MSVDIFRDTDFYEELVEGEVVSVRAGGAAALVASRGQDDRWHVSYLTLEEDPDSKWGYTAEVRYSQSHGSALQCGREFGDLEARTMEDLFSIHPPENEAEKRAWFKKKMELLEREARKKVIASLKKEARIMKEGNAAYPPEESELGQILKEIGTLPE